MSAGTLFLQIVGSAVLGFALSNALADPLKSLKNGSVFVCDGLQGVWVLINGEKREIPNQTIFDQLGLRFHNVVTVSCDLADSIPSGPDLNENDQQVIDENVS